MYEYPEEQYADDAEYQKASVVEEETENDDE